MLWIYESKQEVNEDQECQTVNEAAAVWLTFSYEAVNKDECVVVCDVVS